MLVYAECIFVSVYIIGYVLQFFCLFLATVYSQASAVMTINNKYQHTKNPTTTKEEEKKGGGKTTTTTTTTTKWPQTSLGGSRKECSQSKRERLLHERDQCRAVSVVWMNAVFGSHRTRLQCRRVDDEIGIRVARYHARRMGSCDLYKCDPSSKHCRRTRSYTTRSAICILVSLCSLAK